MYSTKRRGASLNSIIPYTLPKLHTGKNWYIDFKAYDPLEQRMKRKKYMLDSIDKISLRRKRATELIANISHQTFVRLESLGRHFQFSPIYII